MINLTAYLIRFKQRGPASISNIREAENKLAIQFPDDYRNFMQKTNGGEGFIGSNSYIVLWSVDELMSMNKMYEVQAFAPGLLLFGSDGGGEAYGFDVRSSSYSVIQVPFVGMSWTDAMLAGESFSIFLKNLYEVQ